MKNINFRVPLSVILICIIFAFFTGCSGEETENTTHFSQDTTAYSEAVTSTSESEEIPETTLKPLSGWKGEYRSVLIKALEERKKDFPDEINHGIYGLYDFDGDLIPELFVKVYGISTSDDMIYVYDYDGEKAVLLDTVDASHSWVYETNKENSVLLGACTAGENAFSILEFRNGVFESRYIASYYPDGYADIIEPEENPLPSMGYEVKEINNCFLGDFSGIEQLEEK